MPGATRKDCPALREHETLLDVAETVAVELVEHAACAMSASVPSSNPFDEGDAQTHCLLSTLSPDRVRSGYRFIW
jgi:hypothetical protein